MEKVKKLACRKAKGFTLIELPAVRKPGFTLIELLIVIAIIAILATIILVSLSSARNRAKDTQIKGDMNSMSKALEIIMVDRDLTTTGWVNLVDSAVVGDANIANWKDINNKRLIAKLPAHPISGENFRIRISTTQNYMFLARLISANHYWCVRDGSAREVTGTILPLAQTACEL